MKFIFVQFHAAPKELIKMSVDIANHFGLNYYCADITNDVLVFLGEDILKEYESEIKNVEFLIVLLEPKQKQDIKTVSDLKDIKNSGIYINVAMFNENGLNESGIGFSKEKIMYEITDPKKIISKFKKFTRTGAIAFNKKTGAEALSRTHRYTEGAKALYDSGSAIIPFGGGKTVFFKLP